MIDNKQLKYKTVHVKLTCKASEIFDAFNNLRYKVLMTSFDILYNGQYTLSYLILVVNYFYGPEPLIIFERPEIDDPPITDEKIALKIYEDCVKNYTDLVKAETRDFQDIDVYKTKIQYELTCPRCCMTCKWCRNTIPQKDYIYNVSHKYICINPINCKEYNFDIDRHHEQIRHSIHIEQHTGHKYMPVDDSHTIIHPKVQLYGVCKNYVKNDRKNIQIPGDSIVDIIDERINRKLCAEY